MRQVVEQERLKNFAPKVIAWQRIHGRHGLAWQANRTPYSVWVSEIMLQQTQVSTVLTYYARFMARFPTVQKLALAEADEVMSLWAGLGYYSRARNLHRCAKQVVAQWGGQFPSSSSELVLLAGIGPSTAAAIAAFCFNEPVSIFDGNVKRVLSRWLAFAGDLGSVSASKQLYGVAQALLPSVPAAIDMTAYTQGLMDLGATLCTPKKPRCEICPLKQSCGAQASGLTASIPMKSKKIKRSAESWWLLFRTRGEGAQVETWLSRRPDSGIWAGLYAPFVYSSLQALNQGAMTQSAINLTHGEPILHKLTHKDLTLHPVQLHGEFSDGKEALEGNGKWVALCRLNTIGLPAPILSWFQRHARFV